MKLAIMQPYFLPYIGYFQLMAAADAFVVYDNIKYTKKGWINRNRMLRNGTDIMFSLPLKHDSDYKDVRDREIAANFCPEKLLAQFVESYLHAPFLQQTRPLLEDIILCPDRDLFSFLNHSIRAVRLHLGLEAKMYVSSTISIDHRLKSQDKVLAICEALGADTYINAVGGQDLYSREAFAARGIELRFIRPRPLEYSQMGQPFVPWLSVIDVLMFNPLESVRRWIRTHFDLI